MGRINPVVSLAALVALARAACGAARADDFPPRKPGLWQIEMSMPGGPMPPQQIKMCLDPATDAEMYKLGHECKPEHVRQAGDQSQRQHGYRRHGVQDRSVAEDHPRGHQVQPATRRLTRPTPG